MRQNSISFHYEAFHSETLQNHRSANVWVEQGLILVSFLISLFIPFCRAPAVLARTQRLVLIQTNFCSCESMWALESWSPNLKMLDAGSRFCVKPAFPNKIHVCLGVRRRQCSYFFRLSQDCKQLKLKVSYYTWVDFFVYYISAFSALKWYLVLSYFLDQVTYLPYRQLYTTTTTPLAHCIDTAKKKVLQIRCPTRKGDEKIETTGKITCFALFGMDIKTGLSRCWGSYEFTWIYLCIHIVRLSNSDRHWYIYIFIVITKRAVFFPDIYIQ